MVQKWQFDKSFLVKKSLKWGEIVKKIWNKKRKWNEDEYLYKMSIKCHNYILVYQNEEKRDVLREIYNFLYGRKVIGINKISCFWPQTKTVYITTRKILKKDTKTIKT